jgi:hypothetical protein
VPNPSADRHRFDRRRTGASGLASILTSARGGRARTATHATPIEAGFGHTFIEACCVEGVFMPGPTPPQAPDCPALAVTDVLHGEAVTDPYRIGAPWIVEHGSPDVAEHVPWLRAYSAYHNVRPGTRYPATYLLAAMDDGRVDALHARNMAALLQAATPDVPEAGPFLLRTHFHAGHGADKPLAAVIDERTEVWGFLAWRLALMHAEDARARVPDA